MTSLTPNPYKCRTCGKPDPEGLGECDACAHNRPRGGDPLAQQVGGDHYKDFAIQPAEFMHANSIGYLEGSAIYYLCRHRKKAGVEDLKKARHTIDILIDLEEKAANAKESA